MAQPKAGRAFYFLRILNQNILDRSFHNLGFLEQSEIKPSRPKKVALTPFFNLRPIHLHSLPSLLSGSERVP
jgi:hypothetical protein